MKYWGRFFFIAAMCLNSTFVVADNIDSKFDFTTYKVGFELTAVPDNKNHDVTQPVKGKKIDFVRAATKYFKKHFGGTERPAKLKELPYKYNRPLARRRYVTNRYGKWKIENDSGVLEMPHPPFTANELHRAKAVFDTFKAVSVLPEVMRSGKWGGGGHMHGDLTPFEQKPMLLRNLIVFMLNNPWLKVVMEEPGDDQAKTIREWGVEKYFAAELKKIDEKLIDGTATLPDVARAMIRPFELQKPKFWAGWTDNPPTIKWIVETWVARYMDVNVTNILTGRHPTIEMRRMRAPRNVMEVQRRGQFFISLFKYLYSFDEPIPFLQLTANQVRTLEMPEVVADKWPVLIQALDLNPDDFAYELTQRFPVLVSAGRTLPSGHREMEIRDGKWTAKRYVYELRFEGRRKPSFTVKVGYREFPVRWKQFSDDVWIGRMEVPELNLHRNNAFTITAYNGRGNVMPRLTGKYALGSDRLIKDERYNPGRFIPSCDALLSSK